MNRCLNDECILGYESTPEGCSFLDIKDYLSLEQRGAVGELWGYDPFKYCPECGCKFEDILYDYNKKSKVNI